MFCKNLSWKTVFVAVNKDNYKGLTFLLHTTDATQKSDLKVKSTSTMGKVAFCVNQPKDCLHVCA